MSSEKTNGSHESDMQKNYEGEPVVARIGEGRRLLNWRPDEEAPPVDVEALEAMFLLQLNDAEELRLIGLIVDYERWYRASMDVLFRMRPNDDVNHNHVE